MEKLINSIPKQFDWITKKGEKIQQGFSLRYSPRRNKWLCGYAGGRQRFRDTTKDRQWVEADDPVEAVAFFVELVSKKNGKTS